MQIPLNLPSILQSLPSIYISLLSIYMSLPSIYTSLLSIYTSFPSIYTSLLSIYTGLPFTIQSLPSIINYANLECPDNEPGLTNTKTYCMIALNIFQLCRLRGIKSPLTALRKAGISQKVAFKYLKGEKHTLVIKHIEILCKLLNCTPNELFTWQPDSKTDDIPTHTLQVICQKALPDVHQRLNSMKVDELRVWMEEKEGEAG